MDTVHNNLLRFTNCDEELWLNIGNDADVLNSIWKCFAKVYPSESKATKEWLGVDNNTPTDVTEALNLLQLLEALPQPAVNETKNEAARVLMEERQKLDQER